MKTDLVIKNAIVVTPTGLVNGGVAVDDGVIQHVGADSTLGDGTRVVDLEGRILFPGLFDPHTHLGLAGVHGEDSMLEDFRWSTRDALLGGVTTLATTTLPGRDSLVKLFDDTIKVAEGRSWVDYKVTCVVGVRSQIEDIPGVVARGGRSFKFFTGYVGDQAVDLGYEAEGIPPDFFYLACEAIKRTGTGAFPMIHAEDPYVRGLLVDRLRQTPRADVLTAWAESSPQWAESVQLYLYGQVARDVGVKMYPVHLSAAEAVDTVATMRREGHDIVAETVLHSLAATAPELDDLGIGTIGKVQPPIRFDRDRERLWQGIKTGEIGVVGTDSVSHSLEQKQGVDFWDCRVGLPLQFADTLPLMYTEGHLKRNIDLVTLAKVLTENACKMHGIYPRKGVILTGSDADFVVIDPDAETELGVHRYRAHSDYSLWEGRPVRGVPVRTFLRGVEVMADGEIITDSGHGRFAI
jgi:dihydroorotase-like cyclic amidohydrolase